MFSYRPATWGLPVTPWGALDRLAATARAVAFWLAVALPFAYLPLVVAAPAVMSDPTALVGAVGGNVVALVVGHGYEPTLARGAAR